MCPPRSRREFLAVGIGTGMSALAGCADSSESSTPTPSDPDHAATDGESLGLAYAESSGTYPRDEPVHSGWVHIVSDGDSADLTFDARFCGSLGSVDPSLVDAMAGEYVLGFEASGEFVVGDASGDSCGSVTRLVGGANVPNDWERLTVAVNDVEIQSVEQSGTMPELRPLPDPIRPR